MIIPYLRPVRRLRDLKTMFYGFFGPLPKPEKWVFIVGSTNSGTTLLHDIIASHPLVGSLPWEGMFYTDQLKRDKSTLYKVAPYRRIWGYVPENISMDENYTGANVNKLKRQWGARFDDPTKPVLLVKSPDNTARVRWLQKHFENVYFIGMIRNGYAVAEGIRRKVHHDISMSAHYGWCKVNEIMFDNFKHLHRKMFVRYETLTEKPDKCVREVCEFIGIEPDEISVEGKWKIHGKLSTIKNMNYRSFEKLSEDDYRIIEEVAGDMLKKLDYFRVE